MFYDNNQPVSFDVLNLIARLAGDEEEAPNMDVLTHLLRAYFAMREDEESSPKTVDSEADLTKLFVETVLKATLRRTPTEAERVQGHLDVCVPDYLCELVASCGRVPRSLVLYAGKREAARAEAVRRYAIAYKEDNS